MKSTFYTVKLDFGVSSSWFCEKLINRETSLDPKQGKESKEVSLIVSHGRVMLILSSELTYDEIMT